MIFQNSGYIILTSGEKCCKKPLKCFKVVDLEVKTMLFGGYDHKIDKKGRVFIPSAFREELGESFIICKGIFGKGCLCVYSKTEWKNLVEKIGTLPANKSSTLKRFLYDGAFNVEFDAQGRILVPTPLREYAGFDAEVHIIGMDTNLEIWDSNAWATESQSNTLESISSVMEELNF